MNAGVNLRAVGAVLTLVAANVAFSKSVIADVIVGVSEEAPAHYHFGRALCRAMERAGGNENCKAERIAAGHAAAPIAILSDVRNGAIDIGVTRSDWLYHAYNGSGPVEFMDVRFENLRALVVLHSEPFTIVARRDARIAKLDDLEGKRVNIGVAGSRHRLVMDQVMAARGWTRKSFQLADELSGPEQSLALCHNRIQAMVATVSHPDPAIAKTIELCDAEIVEVSGTAIDKLIAAQPYFSATSVPGGLYQGQPGAVKTFGVRVVVVTSEDVSDDQAYGMVKSIVENLDNFKRLHPALAHLRARDMIDGGAAAPLHPGAARYFREKDMM